MDMNKIGKRIQQARQEQGMTQSELSQKLGLTQKYISNIECNTKHPKLETFIAIANALNIDANTLLVDVLSVSDEIQCSALWEKLSKLPEEKRKKLIHMLDFAADEF
ncbi:MAG: helix-turn-helix transcriptional regulator [Oscillospiraceae bacterium]|nr:helix-turn-helix transcriptional regulator [Oscillospiraceae bacterium]